MTNISFKPVAGAPGVFTTEPGNPTGRSISCDGARSNSTINSRRTRTPDLVVSRTANPGFDVVAFSPSGIWDAAKDLAGRAWDEINDVLTDEARWRWRWRRRCSQNSELGRSRNRHNDPGAGTVWSANLDAPLQSRLDPSEKGPGAGH